MAEYFEMDFQSSLCVKTAVITLPGFWTAFEWLFRQNVDISDDKSGDGNGCSLTPIDACMKLPATHP